MLDSKDDEVQPILPDAPKSIDYLSDESKAHWDTVLQSLDALGIRYEIDYTLVRGLDYYTRTVFEFVPPDARRQSTILAGGRYDGLIEELGGQPTPGIGFAMGIERVVAEAKKRGRCPHRKGRRRFSSRISARQQRHPGFGSRPSCVAQESPPCLDRRVVCGASYGTQPR